MLLVNIHKKEMWNEKTEEFFTVEPTTITLEHSLVAISKWEAIFHEPFFSKKEKSREEIKEYVKCMTITQNVNPIVYDVLDTKTIEDIKQYIENPMTATWFSEGKGNGSKKSGEIITSELIYYWMVSYQIPFECQKWHINRLLTLIRICNIKNQPSKKMTKKDIFSSNTALNNARRKAMGTKG